MNQKQAKKLRKLNNQSLDQIKQTIIEKASDDAIGYWNHLTGAKLIDRIVMAKDLILGRKR